MRKEMLSIFADSAVEDDETPAEEIEILGHKFSVVTACDDFNVDKKTLFATLIWSGSKVLSNFILEHGDKYIRNQRVIEFGAGAGLPSLSALAAGASFVCSTDFPAPSVLSSLKKNFEANLTLYDLNCKTMVVGHKWGEDVENLVVDSQLYDVIISAECLWKHESHLILLKSMAACLKPGGIVLLTFSHHIPGLETEDLSFFSKARSFGFEVIETTSAPASHMWSERTVDIYLYQMKLTDSRRNSLES